VTHAANVHPARGRTRRRIEHNGRPGKPKRVRPDPLDFPPPPLDHEHAVEAYRDQVHATKGALERQAIRERQRGRKAVHGKTAPDAPQVVTSERRP